MSWIQSNEVKLSNLQHDLPNDKCNLEKKKKIHVKKYDWSDPTRNPNNLTYDPLLPKLNWPNLWFVVTQTQLTRLKLTQPTCFATSDYICVLNLALYNYIYFAEAHKYFNDDWTRSLTCWIVLILVIWYTHFIKAPIWIKETDECNRRAYKQCSGSVRPMNDTRKNFSFLFFFLRNQIRTQQFNQIRTQSIFDVGFQILLAI